MARFEYSKCFCDFSLILIIFLFFTFPAWMDDFSHSILGKLCAVILIAYYTTHNLVYGLLFCIAVIYYYHYQQEGSAIRMVKLEGMATYPGEPDFPATIDRPLYPERTDAEQEFVDTHCKNGELQYKHFSVHPEMTEHVFPEVKTTAHSVCNPCNPTCKFSLSNQKLRTEEEIVKPKSSNDWFTAVLSRVSY